MPETIALLIFAYLLGSISPAIILSKVMGYTDPRSAGSENPGATNVMRIAGKKAAALTLAGDFLKGVVPVLLARLVSDDNMVVALTALAVFLGHCFPVFYRFRGGKGVATAGAATFGFNWIIGSTICLIWIVFAKVFKISSMAAIFAFGALPPLIFWSEQDLGVSTVLLAIYLILVWRHKGNIQRLIKGTES